MITKTLLIIGCLVLACVVYKLASLVYVYIRPSSLKKYLQKDAYAFVTGASDGIGKALAVQLAGKGFNVILHGRNLEKLNAVSAEIKQACPERTVLIFVHDGSKNTPLDISAFTSLSIKVLVNNVGVGPIKELGKFTANEIEETIQLNCIFPSLITRALLPYFSESTLILNVSSYAGMTPPPFLSVYAATKAFNNAFSNSLSREMENVEVISLITGSVHTGSNRKPITFSRPSAETYAKSVLSIVGCGRKSVMPYWPHALQSVFVSLLPERVVDTVIKSAMEKEME